MGTNVPEPSPAVKNSRSFSLLKPRGQIFISYSTKDAPAVGRLFNELKRAQYRLWMDSSEHGIDIGENFMLSLKENMSESSAVIACLSPDYFRSKYCRAEIDQARAEKKPIFPVLVRPLNPEDDAAFAEWGLKEVQYANLSTEALWQPNIAKLKRRLPPPNRLKWLIRYGGYALAALLGMVIVGVIAFLALTAPEPIVERMGVAVTYFALDDPSIPGDAANRIIDQFAADLGRALETAAPSDLAIGFRAPSELARLPTRIQGETPDERKLSARNIVNGLNVDVVIYGRIEQLPNNVLVIHPEFTVIPQELGIADELANANRFGTSIRTPPELSTQAERALEERSNAIAQVLNGITQFIAEDYPDALETFRGLPTTIDQYDSLGIDDVVQVLIGNTELRIAARQQRTCDRELVLSHVSAAIEAYNRAAGVSGSYSRPYSGLASATYMNARWLPEEYTDPANCAFEFYDPDTLFDALDYIDRAKTAAAQTSENDPYVVAVRAGNEARITYALCALHLSGDDRADEQYCDRFEQAASVVTNPLTPTGVFNQYSAENPAPPGIAMQAALVEGLRGYLSWLRAANALDAGDDATALLAQAADEYTRAITILDPLTTDDNLFQQMLYYATRADIYFEMGELDKAHSDFSLASSLAPDNFADKAYYDDMIVQIESEMTTAASGS